MKYAPPDEYRAIARQKPEEAELVQWLAAIGRPPEFVGTSKRDLAYQRKCWVEETMFEFGIIPEIDEQYYHDWAIDYLDWLEYET